MRGRMSRRGLYHLMYEIHGDNPYAMSGHRDCLTSSPAADIEHKLAWGERPTDQGLFNAIEPLSSEGQVK
jgi:hypothetical protein